MSADSQFQTLHNQLIPEETSSDGGQDRNVMSVVAGGSEISDFLILVDPPSVIHQGTLLTIEYHCRDPYVVGVQLKVVTCTLREVIMFHRWWPCGSFGEPHVQQITVQLEDRLAYRPSHLNRISTFVESAELLAWIVDDPVLDSLKLDIFRQSAVRVSHRVSLLNPYDRPGKPCTDCLSWWMTIEMNKPYMPVCKVEPGEYDDRMI